MSYDFVFIGTSPMCLLEACAKRLNGHSVLMIDRAPTVGGAWKTHKMFGHDDIENGPHFLLYPDGNDFLRDDLGVDLKVVPSPEWLICNDRHPRRLSDGAAMLRISALSAIKALGRIPAALGKGKLREFRTGYRLIRKACRQFQVGLRFFVMKPASLYLRNGSGPLVRALDQYAHEIGIEFRMGSDVTRAIVSNDGPVAIEIDDGATGRVFAGELIVTDHSCINRFVFGQLEYITEFDRRVRTQLHFFVHTEQALDFYLLRFFSEKYFLLSNLSFVYDRAIAPKGKQLLTLALLNTEKPQHLSQVEVLAIMEDFKRWNILPEDAELGDFELTFYDDTLIRPRSRQAIECHAGGRVRFFGRLDLSELISQRAGFWREGGFERRRLAHRQDARPAA